MMNKTVIDMVRPFSLRVEKGEQLAIIGPNASGKSKIAGIIAGQTDAKYITFKDSCGYSSDQNYFMQQRWNMFTVDSETPSVSQTLQKCVASSKDPSSANHRLDELIGLFGLDSLMDKLPVCLSSGELRKFQLVKLLLDSPSILIIDSPYIGLDPASRALLTRVLSALVQEGRLTLILLLPILDQIPPFITHVIALDAKCAPDSIPLCIETQTLDNYVNTCLNPPVIKMNHVTIKYSDRIILNDLNWTVRQGEHWALTGANGCGKTTLLSLICADNPQAYACDIELFGRKRGSGETIWDIKHKIGYVSPEMHRSFRTDAPAIDIVASGLFDTEGLFRKVDEQQRESCRTWMEKFGASHLADRQFMRLSSGEQRLCLVVRAFVKDPPLYILDEPLHGLDENVRMRVKGLIGEICSQEGKTLLMVTHYPEEYPSCIDHSLTLTGR